MPVFRHLSDGGGVVGGLKQEAHPVAVVLAISPPDLTAPAKARYVDPG